MDELVSRQAAIDALKRKKDKNAKGDMAGFYNTIIQNDIDALMQLPSKQAKPTFEQIKEYCERRCLTIITNDFYHDLITTYSAQPERKTGKWVGVKEYCDHLNEKAEREGNGHRFIPSGMNICVYCNQCWESNDRRTTYCPNCGADMRGGEHATD